MLKTKLIQKLLKPTNAFWKDLLVELNTQSEDKHRSLGPLDIKTYRNKAMMIFLDSCLMLAYISPRTNSLSPQIYNLFLNSPSFKIHTLNGALALIISIFTVSQPRKHCRQRQIYHNQGLLQIYLPAGLISYTRFEENLVVIPNDWKSKFRKETSQKSMFKIFYLKTAVLEK